MRDYVNAYRMLYMLRATVEFEEDVFEDILKNNFYELWSDYSEESWCAGFLIPDKESLDEFIDVYLKKFLPTNL